jgi:hypothetical protein
VIMWRSLIFVGLTGLVALALCGCDVSDRDMVGEYFRKGSNVTERLVLKLDHTYEQELIYVSGRRVTQTNTWERNQNLNCRDFYSAVDGATGDEIEPPKLYSLSNLQVERDMLIGIYEKGYYFTKK